jgi:hypothetical protein
MLFEETWTPQCVIKGSCSLELVELFFEKDLIGDVCVEENEEKPGDTDFRCDDFYGPRTSTMSVLLKHE